jgi:RimJ/RimL family protein N-acetyltransferase
MSSPPPAPNLVTTASISSTANATRVLALVVSPPPPRRHPIRLRPPEATDDAFLAELRQRAVAGEFNWFGDPAAEDADHWRDSVERMIVTLADGTAIGGLSWMGSRYGPNLRSIAWKIGITLLPAHRGRGYGALAQTMLADHLFATTPSNRVEADTDVDNIAEQRALERAGFTREGVLRGAQYRDGRWRDLVLYSKVRTDVSSRAPHGDP